MPIFEVQFGLQEMTLYDDSFDIIRYGRRDIEYVNIEKTRALTDTRSSYKFGEGTEPTKLLKLYALNLSNESNKYTR